MRHRALGGDSQLKRCFPDGKMVESRHRQCLREARYNRAKSLSATHEPHDDVEVVGLMLIEGTSSATVEVDEPRAGRVACVG